MTESQIAGCIIGTAVGDALGLPYEGVSRSRSPRLLGPPTRHRFLFGRGMVSDDTEHTCMAAQSLIATSDVDSFLRDFAGRLRWWVVLLPAGIGRATLRASIRLWFGSSPQNSGVFSAGNGPAMRSAIFGAGLDDMDLLVQYVRACSSVTHSDPRAQYGAVAVALAAHTARHKIEADPEAFVDVVAQTIGPDGEELTGLLREVVRSVSCGQSTSDFALQQGMHQGVSGYAYHTVPVVIHAWLSHQQDFPGAVTAVIECGGDADTTAAIVGGIVGTATGVSGIPAEWISTICEWPRSVHWMNTLGRQLAESLDQSTCTEPIRLNPVLVAVRNLFFLGIVLFHGFRRLFPPY